MSRSADRREAPHTPTRPSDTWDPIVIAIDGPAASGKGTLAERLARHFGYPHLESGQIYRAVAAKLLAAGHAEAEPEVATRIARSEARRAGNGGGGTCNSWWAPVHKKK